MRRKLAQVEPQLADAEHGQRDRERHDVIEQPEQQQAREQILLVELPQPDEHCHVEYAEPAGRGAGKAEQRRHHEDDRKRHERDVRFARHQHEHRERAAAEIDDADQDLQQGQRTARKRHLPIAAADLSRRHPHPADIDRKHQQNPRRQRPIEPDRQLVDGACRARIVGNAQAEHRRVAEPEGQAGDKADLRHVDRGESPDRIDAVADRRTGEHARPDVVADRIAGEAGKRGDPIGHGIPPDRAQREQIIERQREIAGRNEQPGQEQVAQRRPSRRPHDLSHVDVVEHAIEHDRRDRDDGDAQRNPDPVPADPFCERPPHGAQRLEHFIPRWTFFDSWTSAGAHGQARAAATPSRTHAAASRAAPDCAVRPADPRSCRRDLGLWLAVRRARAKGRNASSSEDLS